MICSKVTYPTRGEAQKGARLFFSTVRKKQKKRGAVLNPYRCDHCDFWHLTSRENSR